MRIITLASLLPFAALCACKAVSDVPTGSYPSDTDRARVAAEMAELAAIGPEHAELARRVGSWSIALKVRGGADGEWIEESGTSTVVTRLDKRYLVEQIDATVNGLPYKGYHVMGFDKLQQQYFSVWMDTQTTWPHAAFGEKDDEGVVRMMGRTHDAVTPGGRPFRVEVRRVSDDEFVNEVYDTIDDQFVKIMEIRRTRVSQ